jgi:hypothetical protein
MLQKFYLPVLKIIPEAHSYHLIIWHWSIFFNVQPSLDTGEIRKEVYEYVIRSFRNITEDHGQL